MERITPLYVIMDSMENLHFDKEGYFHIFVFYALFYKKNRKHFFLCSHTYRNTRVTLGELEIAPYGSSFSQTSTRVSITVWKHGKCFLFLKYYSQFFHENRTADTDDSR